ncbi:MAG: DUF4157 domain-containing protein [Nostoc sp. NOS(2021)]|uniref:eCIS core domain-containing protein n=1 Tax=Nostoc sp. NOS(2021) TaxID=2815407 RepID=UPI0025E4C4A7|nr:DUF4157 domain-containing protein [Nostoc sp. NOS(2021)]MBN3895957.1 DUF4157 domain-containing protein [Nostoc sp. NOS(2021)]
MREPIGKPQKATTASFSIPTLKQPTRGFGLDSPGASSQAVPLVQPLNKPLVHDISRISLRPQTKLTVNQPGDVYEQEADKVAQQVMQKQSIQREALPESEEELQMKSVADSVTPVVQRQGGGVAATSDLETSIQQARQSGQPLADDIRQPMEQAFGTDFSSVKIHTDSRSDQLNQSIQARAFTTGQDIFFRQGEYAPDSHGGKELLAHELTHVVQQNGSALERKSLPDEGIKKNKIQAETLLNSASGYPAVIQCNPFEKVKKFFSKDRGDTDNGGDEIEEIQVNGEDWKKYMELDILTMQPSDIITDRQFGHNLYINIRWYNKSQKRLRLMTPPPLEYFEEITKITTDNGGNRTTETESVDQYANRPNSNTFRSYVLGTRGMIVDPGKSLTARFLDPPQITITQEYKSRTVKFKIGLQGSQQWLTGVQRLTCENNKIIEHEFIATILRAG